jgi:hypothetical protein
MLHSKNITQATGYNTRTLKPTIKNRSCMQDFEFSHRWPWTFFSFLVGYAMQSDSNKHTSRINARTLSSVFFSLKMERIGSFERSVNLTRLHGVTFQRTVTLKNHSIRVAALCALCSDATLPYYAVRARSISLTYLLHNWDAICSSCLCDRSTQPPPPFTVLSFTRTINYRRRRTQTELNSKYHSIKLRRCWVRNHLRL